MNELEEIVSVSHYAHRPAERKKIKFILSAVTRFAQQSGRDLRDLSVLEVGCGAGGVTLPLARLGCSIRGFDIDAESIAILNSRASDLGLENVTATVDNGYEYADGKTYDIVVASEVFEHVLDPSRLATNIETHMRDGSYLIATVPNGYGPWEIRNKFNIRIRLRKWNFLRRLRGKAPYVKGQGSGHCQFFTRRRLIGLLARHLFQPISFAKSNSLLSMSGRLSDNRFFGQLDTRLADILPYWLASGWYFVFEYRGADSKPHA